MSEIKGIFENLNIDESIARVDNLLTSNLPGSGEQMGTCLGIRLALEMAREIINGSGLGSQSSTIIANWVKEFGENQVETAIQAARSFITQPENLKNELEKRLFPE